MKSAKIITIRNLGSSFIEMWLEEKDIAHLARPGQFVMISPGNTFDPFLKRPLAILSTQETQFGLLFEIVGRGTELLSQFHPGDLVPVFGPLGNGFSLSPKEAILIAGGRGLVPLSFLANYFHQKKIPYIFFFGMKDHSEAVLSETIYHLQPSLILSCQEKISGQYHGTVLDAFTDWLAHSSSTSETTIYTCGPQEMYQEMSQIKAITSFRVEISLESRMGCGYGVCLSCAVKKKGFPGYYHVCKDGPVFRLGEVEL